MQVLRTRHEDINRIYIKYDKVPPKQPTNSNEEVNCQPCAGVEVIHHLDGTPEIDYHPYITTLSPQMEFTPHIATEVVHQPHITANGIRA